MEVHWSYMTQTDKEIDHKYSHFNTGLPTNPCEGGQAFAIQHISQPNTISSRSSGGGGDRRCCSCKFIRRCRRDGPAEIEILPAFGFGATPLPLMFIAQSDIVGAVLAGIAGRCDGSTTLGATSAAPFAVRVVADAIAPVIVSARRRLIVS